MKRRLGHILSVIILLWNGFTLHGQTDRIDGRLDTYESLCSQCIGLKARISSGESVSRSQAQSLIGCFLEMNRDLKSHEAEMTPAQRYRFAAIGKWFSTGEPPAPVMPPLPVVASSAGQIFYDVPSYDGLLPVTYSDAACHKPYDSVYILADMAFVDMSYGLMVGYTYKRYGAYLNFRSNFTSSSADYECMSDGTLPGGGSVWPSGTERRSNLHVSGGLLANVNTWLSLYAGAGYGYRRLAWEDVEGQWALVSDVSHRGLAADAGLLLSARKLVFSAGVSTVAFRTASFTCGLGVRF